MLETLRRKKWSVRFMSRKIDSTLVKKAVWNNNYWVRDKKPDCVFVHIMCGKLTAVQCGANVFKKGKVSSNYGIGYKGDYCQYVEEKYGAFAQGSKYWNKRGISIELGNSTGANGGWKISNETLESCIELVADIFIRNGFGYVNYTGNTKGNLLMHKWVANTSCPGNYVAAKFPYIAEEANKIIDGKVRLHARGYFKRGDKGRSVRNLKKWLKKNGYYKGTSLNRTYSLAMVRAVKRFQKKNGLEIDGLWGKNCNAVYEKIKWKGEK